MAADFYRRPPFLHVPWQTAIMTTMTTVTSNGLQSLLGAIGVGSIPLAFDWADIYNNPLGIFTTHLADVLVTLTECEPKVAYDSISWSNDMSHLVVVAPRLRIRDTNSEDLAADLQQRVCLIVHARYYNTGVVF